MQGIRQRPVADDEGQRSAERWQSYQIVFWDGLHRFAGFPPCGQSAHNHERIEAPLPQQVRHTGAGCFARSSTVEINILLAGKVFEFFFKIIRLDSDRVLDARCTRIVIPMAAHVDDLHFVCIH
ncbi:MAG: hypothetical protein JWQ87_301 [Candidatus Sulfotelmatobacter sp.]|nr:hypothetical protein [Candidatus Sulfotelmatobacter sp.]